MRVVIGIACLYLGLDDYKSLKVFGQKVERGRWVGQNKIRISLVTQLNIASQQCDTHIWPD